MSSPSAFILAAGLGTRLAPLTDMLPKPLVPVFHKPLLTFALDSLLAAGFGSLALNTHHLPDAFPDAFGEDPSYRGHSLRLFHEPRLLDTGGGIRNARPALGEGTFLVYNGDILGDLPLADFLAHHRSSGNMATLLLRPSGGAANVLYDPASGRIEDLRGVLGVSEGVPLVYSGVALFEQEIFGWIPPDGPYSIIDALLEAMQSGAPLGGFLVEEGLWIDLGTPEAYLRAHGMLADPAMRPSYVSNAWPTPIHPDAVIHPGASLSGMVAAAPGSRVGEGAELRDVILWPGAEVTPGARLEGCIVSGRAPVSGIHRGGVL